jgi:phosphatidylserine decarboxylase
LNNHDGQKFFSDEKMNDHLKEIMNDYANMLKSPKSLKYMTKREDGWFSPNALKKINYDDFVCDPKHPNYGFENWNDWFTRALKPNARPIDHNPNVIVNTSEHYPLTDRTLPVKNIGFNDQFWLKDNSYSLEKMFEAKKYKT